METKYNVLVIGKTGVGKSSFVNYLFGERKAETGTGKPVTGKSHNQYDLLLNNKFPIVLYDSWGLEADKHKEWMSNFESELKKHGTDKPATEWFHSVFYLINAAGHRVEDADISIIKRMREEHYCVNVILNKCDLVSDSEENTLKEAILKEIPGIEVIGICSGGENRRGPTEPFGIDKVKEKVISDFFDALITRLPKYLTSELNSWSDSWKKTIRKKISGVRNLNSREVSKEIDNISKKEIERIKKGLDEKTNDTLIAYDQIIYVFCNEVVHVSPIYKKIEIIEMQNKWLKLFDRFIPEKILDWVVGVREKNIEAMQLKFDQIHERTVNDLRRKIDEDLVQELKKLRDKKMKDIDNNIAQLDNK